VVVGRVDRVRRNCLEDAFLKRDDVLAGGLVSVMGYH
jgi:hypothetical protein